MSLYSYIHEWDFYDNAMIAAHDVQRECAVAEFELSQAEQLAMKKVMLESADYDVLMEAAKENFFVRVGKAVTNLIKKIADFLKGIFDKVFNRTKNQERERNIAIAKQYLAKHPEQRDTIISAMERGDMDLKDVAQYARDVEQVIKLAERQETEADTLNNKVNDVCKKIDNSAPINVAKTLGTIGLAVGGVVTLYKGLGDLTGMVTDVQELVKKQKDIIDKSNDLQDSIKKYGNMDHKVYPGVIAKGKILRDIDTIKQDRASVAAAKINPIGKLVSKLILMTKGYAAALKECDKSIEQFNQSVDTDNYHDALRRQFEPHNQNNRPNQYNHRRRNKH